MATNINTPPPKSTSAKNAAENSKEIKQKELKNLKNKYSIAATAAEKDHYKNDKSGDLRAYHNFRKEGNTPRSFFMSNDDFVFSNTFTMTNTIKNSGTSVQSIILNEFQPLPYRDMIFMLNDLLSFGAGIANGFSRWECG